MVDGGEKKLFKKLKKEYDKWVKEEEKTVIREMVEGDHRNTKYGDKTTFILRSRVGEEYLEITDDLNIITSIVMIGDVDVNLKMAEVFVTSFDKDTIYNYDRKIIEYTIDENTDEKIIGEHDVEVKEKLVVSSEHNIHTVHHSLILRN